MAEIPLRGDRAARDCLGYPDLHGSDLEAATPVQHLPEATSVGDMPYWDGAKWVTTQEALASRYHQSVFTLAGVLSVTTGKLRIYNKIPALTITSVFLSVDTAPTGASIIVDIHKDGATIFPTQADRPSIPDAANTGGTGTLAIAWPADSYLQADVDQVGSAVAGSDLTIHIIAVETG